MITVKGRELIIPRSERQIGTPYDNNAEVRHIRIDRVTSGGIDIANLNSRLDLEYANNVLDTCLLDVEVQEEYILLTWTIPDTCLTQKGTVWIAVRAYDENGSIKWATNRGAVYVGHTIFDGPAYTGKLSELEQLEERITQKTEILDANESERKEAEEQRKVNEERRVNNEAEWQRQAETAINTANETLREAKEQAGIATQKATESTQKAKESSDSATAAAGSAATASEKEAVATQKAKEASDSATAAAGSAVVAGEKEATATQKAAEAKNSADDAKRYAEQCAGVAGFDGTASTVSAIDTQGVAVRKASGTGHVTITAGGPEPDVGLEYFGQPGDKVTVQDMCDSLAAPGFDDSGVVQGISGFSDFLNRMTSGMRLPSFFRDLKAGLKFVLHTGQLVNNGLCNEPGKYPLDAAYGRTLLEMIGNTANLPGGAADIVSAIVAQNSNLANGYPLSICIKDELENSLLKIQGFADGNAGISLNKDDGTIYRIFLNADGRLRFGKYNNNWSISDVLTNANIQRGRTTVIELPPGEITSKHYTFPKQFSSTPNVVATLFSNSTSIKYGLLTMTVHNITATGFDLRFYNNADIKFAPAVDWIAVS